MECFLIHSFKLMQIDEAAHGNILGLANDQSDNDEANDTEFNENNEQFTLLFCDDPCEGPIRLIFKYSGIPQKELYPSSPEFNDLPAVVFNGKRLTQAAAILRYMGNGLQLQGSNDWEDLQIDIAVEMVQKLLVKINFE